MAEQTVFPCGNHQLRWLALEEEVGAFSCYNIPLVFQRKGPIDLKKMKTSLETLVNTHEALRVSIGEYNGRACQIMHPKVAVSIKQYNLSKPTLSEYRQLFSQLTSEAIIYSHVPLFRINIIWHNDLFQTFIISLSHIIADVESSLILSLSLLALYHEKKIFCPKRTFSYLDYIKFDQMRHLQQDYSTKLKFWKKYLDGYQSVHIPHNKILKSSSFKQDCEVYFDAHCLAHLHQEKKAIECTTFEYFLAIFMLSTFAVSNQEDISILLPISERRNRSLMKTAGFLSGPVLFRLQLYSNLTVTEWINYVSNNLRSIITNFLPLRLIDQYIFKGNDACLSSSLMLDSNNMKHFQSQIIDGIEYGLPTEIIGTSNSMGMAIFVNFMQYQHHVKLHIDYDASLYQSEMIQNWIDDFEWMLKLALKNRDEVIKNIMTSASTHYLRAKKTL